MDDASVIDENIAFWSDFFAPFIWDFVKAWRLLTGARGSLAIAPSSGARAETRLVAD